MAISNSKYSGLTIGFVFTLSSFLLAFTFIVPMITIIPVAMIIEPIAGSFTSDEHDFGRLVIFLLLICSVAVILLSLLFVRRKVMAKQEISTTSIVVMMLIFYSFVHPLGFYIYWGVNLNFRSDGQLIFAACDSFPFSSLFFAPFGLLIDWTRNTVVKEIKNLNNTI